MAADAPPPHPLSNPRPTLIAASSSALTSSALTSSALTSSALSGKGNLLRDQTDAHLGEGMAKASFRHPFTQVRVRLIAQEVPFATEC